MTEEIIKDLGVFAGNPTCSTKHSISEKLTCGLIDNRDDFLKFGLMDNFEATTMKLKPRFWDLGEYILFKVSFQSYCDENMINYYLIPEYGKNNSNLHLHGLMGFPCNKTRRRFASWYCRKYGQLYTSVKTDLNYWYKYITGDVAKKQQEQPSKNFYLFDEAYEPHNIVFSN